MKIAYQVESVKVPDSTTGKGKRSSPIYKIVETLLTSNMMSAVVELENITKAESFYCSSSQYIKKDALPVRIARRGLSVYVIRKERV